MAGRFANRSSQLKAMIEPFADLLNRPHTDHAHGGFSAVRLATGSPGVGSCPASIVSTPFSILYGYSKSPRSGGPDARDPSRWHGHMKRPDCGNQRTGQPRWAQLIANT